MVVNKRAVLEYFNPYVVITQRCTMRNPCNCNLKYRVIPVHAPKAYGGNRAVAPLTLNLCSSFSLMVQHIIKMGYNIRQMIMQSYLSRILKIILAKE
jgi:hypothetical protein